MYCFGPQIKFKSRNNLNIEPNIFDLENQCLPINNTLDFA